MSVGFAVVSSVLLLTAFWGEDLGLCFFLLDIGFNSSALDAFEELSWVTIEHVWTSVIFPECYSSRALIILFVSHYVKLYVPLNVSWSQ